MSASTTSFISFKINNIDFCVDTTCVKTILEKSECTPVPNSNPYIEGMVEYLDSILLQINIHKYFFNIDRDKSIRHSLLVCETQDSALAFKVDSINGIYEVENDKLMELDMVMSKSRDMIKNVFTAKDVINQVIDIDYIYKDVREDVTVD